MSDHTVRELIIFKRFASVCSLQIPEDTIVKQDPPAPDILCQANGAEVAFEMVEAIEFDIAKNINLSIVIPERLYDAYYQLPDVEREAVDKAVGNAVVGITFLPYVSKTARSRAILHLFQELQNIDPDYEGDYEFQPGSPLYKSVEKLNIIRRDSFDQPYFNLMGTESWVGDPTAPAIQSKFRKSYPQSYPVELLVYYEFQPKVGRVDIATVKDFVCANIGGSSFRRVWAYDLHTEAILFVVP